MYSRLYRYWIVNRTRCASAPDAQFLLLAIVIDNFRLSLSDIFTLAGHIIYKIELACNLEHYKAFDIKECVLAVQMICLKDLAIEENHVKDFARILRVSKMDLEKSHKEVERVIMALHRPQ